MKSIPYRLRDSWPTLALAAGLIVRLGIAPLGAHPGDFATLTAWATALDTHTLLDIYKITDANYPPLALALLAGSRWLCGLIAPGPLAGPAWMILVKLPGILADIGIGWLVWRAGARYRAFGWIFALTVFNPALIYLSAWWGQYESVYMLGALAAALAALDNRYFRAGLWLGLGVMVKLQAAVLLPVILMAALDRSPRPARTLRLIGGLGIPVLCCLGPYALDGQIELVMLRLVALVSGPGWLTVNALNLWFLATGGAGNWGYQKPLAMPDNTPVLAGITAHTIGLALLGLWTLTALARGWSAHRHGDRARPLFILHTASLLYLGVFLWPTQAHERYAFGAVVLLAVAAANHDPSGESPGSAALWYPLATLLHTLNLIWAAPFDPALDGWLAGNVAIGVGIALGFVGMAVWLLVKFVPHRTTRFCPP